MYAKLKEHLSDERIDLLCRSFEAANNFYQIIPLKRLLRIINSQNSEPYTEEYLEHTPQYSAMHEFCKGIAKSRDDEAIEDILSEILFTIKSEKSDPFEALEFINKFSMRLDVKEKKLPEFIKLYCDLHNNTRNPYLNGFTPNEWFQRTGDKAASHYLDPEDY